MWKYFLCSICCFTINIPSILVISYISYIIPSKLWTVILAGRCHTCLWCAYGCNLLSLPCHFVDLRIWVLLMCWELYLPLICAHFLPRKHVCRKSFNAQTHSPLSMHARTWQTVTLLIIACSHIKDIVVGWRTICLQIYVDQEAEISLQAKTF